MPRLPARDAPPRRGAGGPPEAIIQIRTLYAGVMRKNTRYSKCASYTLLLPSPSRRASEVLLALQKHYNILARSKTSNTKNKMETKQEHHLRSNGRGRTLGAEGEHRSNAHASSSTWDTHEKSTVVVQVLAHVGTESRRQSQTKSKTHRLCAMLHSTSSSNPLCPRSI